MAPLSQDEFFTRLSDLFANRKNKEHGGIYLTQKRLSHDQELPDVSDSSAILSRPLPILVRATDGKSKTKREDRVKLSTVVAPDALDGFYARYADVCKAGMTALKPRDRTKRKAKAKKKKVGMGQTSMAAIP